MGAGEGKVPTTEILKIGGKEFIQDTRTGAISHQTANCLITALADGNKKFKIGDKTYLLDLKRNLLIVNNDLEINLTNLHMQSDSIENCEPEDEELLGEELKNALKLALSEMASESWIVRQLLKRYAKKSPENMKTLKDIELYDIVFQDEAKKAA